MRPSQENTEAEPVGENSWQGVTFVFFVSVFNGSAKLKLSRKGARVSKLHCDRTKTLTVAT